MAVAAKLGAVALNSTGNQTSLVMDGAKVTLSGGTVTMSKQRLAELYLRGAATTDTLRRSGESISGAGHIGNGQMTLTNSGTINSDDLAAHDHPGQRRREEYRNFWKRPPAQRWRRSPVLTRSPTQAAPSRRMRASCRSAMRPSTAERWTPTGASTLQLSNGIIHGGTFDQQRNGIDRGHGRDQQYARRYRG